TAVFLRPCETQVSRCVRFLPRLPEQRFPFGTRQAVVVPIGARVLAAVIEEPDVIVAVLDRHDLLLDEEIELVQVVLKLFWNLEIHSGPPVRYFLSVRVAVTVWRTMLERSGADWNAFQQLGGAMHSALLAVLLGVYAGTALAVGADDDLILSGGKVFTAVLGTPFAEALAVHDGRIVAVGNTRDIEARAGPRTRRMDLHGRVVVPGFNDAHVHFWPDPAGVQLRFDTMEPSWEDVQAALEGAVASAPANTLILGRVGRGVVLNEEVTRFALDRIAPNH